MWEHVTAAPPSKPGRSKSPRGKLGWLTPLVALASVPAIASPALASVPAIASPALAGTLPRPCKLLTKAQAEAAVNAKLQGSTLSGPTCTWNSSPTATNEAQLFIALDTSTPQTLLTDRRLGHHFWKVPSLGPKGVEEQWAIFALKDGVWLTMSMVRLDQWAPYKQRLVVAAQEALSRLGQVVHPKAGLEQLEANARAAQTTPTPYTPAPSPTSSGTAKWTGKELLYGGSIGHYPGVVYEPDVVVIGGGANAIRSVSSDMLTWTIDGHAPGAARLHVGSIMLATSLASGRVVKLVQKGPNLQVTLVPASLTDIIRDGTFEAKDPVPLGHPLDIGSAPPATVQSSSSLQSALAYPTADLEPQGVPTPSTGTTGAKGSDFQMHNICCGSGMGSWITYDSPFGRFSIVVALNIPKPEITYEIDITNAHLNVAQVKLVGSAELFYSFFGATLSSDGDVKSIPIEIPGSVTIPLAGPLAVTISQAFDVSMQLAGRATLKTTGKWKISGALGFRYAAGNVSPDQTSMSATDPITENAVSLGVGENSFSLGWRLRLTVGLGVGGLAAGAWFEIIPGLSLVADGNSSLASLKFGCAQASLDVKAKFGAGWQIPQYIAKPINALLGLLRINPIPTTGGPSWGPYPVWKENPHYCPTRK